MDNSHKDREGFRDKIEAVSEEEIIKVDFEEETHKVTSEVATDHKVASENDKNQSRILFIILVAILVKFSQFALWFL